MTSQKSYLSIKPNFTHIASRVSRNYIQIFLQIYIFFRIFAQFCWLTRASHNSILHFDNTYLKQHDISEWTWECNPHTWPIFWICWCACIYNKLRSLILLLLFFFMIQSLAILFFSSVSFFLTSSPPPHIKFFLWVDEIRRSTRLMQPDTL